MFKKKKGLLGVSLILMLVISAAVPALALQPESFSDVPSGHWAYHSIMNMVRLGVIEGYPDGTFKPDKHVSREEFAKILCGATNDPIITPGNNTFEDVKRNYWAFSYVETVKNYLTGYPGSNGKPLFKGTQDATREDVAVALVKIKGFDKTVASNPNILKDMYKDTETISSNLRSLIAIAVQKKLITGYPDETIRGTQTLTRAEAATLIDRANTIAGDVKNISDRVNNNNNNGNIETKTPPKFLYVNLDCDRAVGKVGEKLQATVKCYYTDGQCKTITDQANLKFSNDSIISVNGNGQITLLKEGTTKIRATYNGKYDEQVITVLPRTPSTTESLKLIKVSPIEKTVKINESVNMKAEAVYDNGKITSITNDSKWESTNNDIAIVSSNGWVTGLKEGTSLIKVTYKDYMTYSVITVIKEAPKPPDDQPAALSSICFPATLKELKVNEKISLQVIANYSDDSKKDITSEVKWTSSNADVAKVSESGEVTAKAEGTVKISAEKDGKTCYMYVIISKE